MWPWPSDLQCDLDLEASSPPYIIIQSCSWKCTTSQSLVARNSVVQKTSCREQKNKTNKNNWTDRKKKKANVVCSSSRTSMQQVCSHHKISGILSVCSHHNMPAYLWCFHVILQHICVPLVCLCQKMSVYLRCVNMTTEHICVPLVCSCRWRPAHRVRRQQHGRHPSYPGGAPMPPSNTGVENKPHFSSTTPHIFYMHATL